MMGNLNANDLLTLAAIIDAEAVREGKHKPGLSDVIRFLRPDKITNDQVVRSLVDLIRGGFIEERWYGGYSALRPGRSVFPIGIFDPPHGAKARKHARHSIAQREAA